MLLRGYDKADGLPLLRSVLTEGLARRRELKTDAENKPKDVLGSPLRICEAVRRYRGTTHWPRALKADSNDSIPGSEGEGQILCP